MIDNEKVKKAISDWSKNPMYSKTETDFFDQCGYIGNLSRAETITFYAGYVAGHKEAEEGKWELIDALIDVAESRIFCEDSMDRKKWLESNVRNILEKATGKSIEELL